MSSLDEARQAMRLRQGQGARYDAAEAPHDGLSRMRRGTAYLARKINELDDAGLYRASRLPGRSRAHVICAVAYHGRALARQAEAAATGQCIPPHRADEWAELEDLDLGATLPAQALRHLFDHSAIHLDVALRDLPGSSWGSLASGPDGGSRTFRSCVDERSRMLWLSALDLINGAIERDLPDGMANASRPDY